MNQIFEKLGRYGVIPVIVIESADSAVGLADALLEGGLPVAEITFRTDAAADVIKIIRQKRPQLLIGAGTVLSIENLEKAKDCGAQFAVAPGLNPKVAERAAKIDMPFIPGAVTPTEIEAALSIGCKVLKFFPAEACGGIKMLKAISAPYKHTGIKFMPTGGISISNLQSYLEIPTVLACGGSWVAEKDSITNKRWDEISTRCKEIGQIVNKLSR